MSPTMRPIVLDEHKDSQFLIVEQVSLSILIELELLGWLVVVAHHIVELFAR